MRPSTLVLVMAFACGGCSTSRPVGATEYAMGPQGVDIVTAAHPYILPPVFQMATTYCARYGGAPTLSSVRRTFFGSLVNRYSCGTGAQDADGPTAPEPAPPFSR